MSKKKLQPEIINLSVSELDEIRSRFYDNSLTDADKKIILSILNIYQWLSVQLQSAKLSILKLRRVFGFLTEKRDNKKLSNDSESGKDNEPSTPDKPPKK